MAVSFEKRANVLGAVMKLLRAGKGLGAKALGRGAAAAKAAKEAPAVSSAAAAAKGGLDKVKDIWAGMSGGQKALTGAAGGAIATRLLSD